MFAIENLQFEKFGCPHCGSFNGHSFVFYRDAKIWSCEGCRNNFAITDKPECTIPGIVPIFDRHPLDSQAEIANVYDAGVMETQGCFCVGGSPGLRASIVLELPSHSAAEHVEWMFETGAHVNGDLVIIGADSQYIDKLHDIMWHVLTQRSIDISVIVANQVQVHREITNVRKAS